MPVDWPVLLSYAYVCKCARAVALVQLEVSGTGTMMTMIATSEWTTGLPEQMQQTAGEGRRSFNPAVQGEVTPAGDHIARSFFLHCRWPPGCCC